MTTNNHPAHGPVSLERLHQISKILSKAAAQSDGGNLGYAMADAVKVIDGVIAGRKAEPVGTFRKGPCGYYPSFHEEAVPLYAAPPTLVVPEDIPDSVYEILCQACGGKAWMYEEALWNACRAAMLQAGNSPVTTDGYVLVPVEPTEDMVIHGFESEPHPLFQPDDWDKYQTMSGCEQAAHRAKLCWAAMVAAAPKQELKNG